MKTKKLGIYTLFASLAVAVASVYPLYMGVRVIADMIRDGSVSKENYPKYIIPYTPICLALLLGVLLIPICFKYLRRFALLGGSAAATALFFASELLLESKVVVSSVEITSQLRDWQMYMCYAPSPEYFEQTYKLQTPVEILMGDYNPAFKLHFYVISVILILSILNCIYGFAHIILSGERKGLRALILQGAASSAFLGLCILACFTAFWRDGSLTVSPLSAALMAIFFILLGIVGGIYTGSFTLGRGKPLSLLLPAAVSAALTLVMYIGEMILLHGNLYRLGAGLLFDGLPVIVLAPIDILIISASGILTCILLIPANKTGKIKETNQTR